MAAAESVFAKRGFKAATIGAISSSAGVNRALIYYYSKAKTSTEPVQQGRAPSATFDCLPPRRRPSGNGCRPSSGLRPLHRRTPSRVVRRELVVVMAMVMAA
jgi:hypothetical protein